MLWLGDCLFFGPGRREKRAGNPALHAKIASTTLPATSVRRKSRPWKR